MDGSAYCLDGVVTLVDTPRTPIHTAGNARVLARQTKIKYVTAYLRVIGSCANVVEIRGSGVVTK